MSAKRIQNAVAAMAMMLGGCGSPPARVARGPVEPIAERLKTADPVAGATVFAACTACHTIGAGATDTDGPNLYGVVGGPVAGRRERFAYTAALREVGGIWDAPKLDRWLTDPQRFVPGTKMAFAGLPDSKQRADVIAYLATQGGHLPSP